MSLLQRWYPPFRIASTVLAAVLFLPFVPRTLYSQLIPHASVRGRVLDDSTRSPLPLSNVFVSGSTIGAGADAEGKFELKGVPFGNQEIVASVVGYAPQTKSLRLVDTTVYEMEFRLKPRTVQVQGVEVEANTPKEWKENLQRFLKEFLGTTPNAEQCRVLNSEVLDFAIGGTGLFVATAREPLEIENRALGYHIRCFLDYFTLSEKPAMTFSAQSTEPTPNPHVIPGDPHFTTSYVPPFTRVESNGPASTPATIELLCRTRFTPLESGSKKELAQWKESRRKTHFASIRHFLTSLVSKNSEQDQFEVYELRATRSRAVPVLRMKVDADTLLGPGEFDFERRLSFGGTLQIVYDGADETQRSLIRLERPPVIVYMNGTLPDPLSITTYGYWATQRVAEMLPIDYRPDE